MAGRADFGSVRVSAGTDRRAPNILMRRLSVMVLLEEVFWVWAESLVVLLGPKGAMIQSNDYTTSQSFACLKQNSLQ